MTPFALAEALRRISLAAARPVTRRRRLTPEEIRDTLLSLSEHVGLVHAWDYRGRSVCVVWWGLDRPRRILRAVWTAGRVEVHLVVRGQATVVRAGGDPVRLVRDGIEWLVGNQTPAQAARPGREIDCGEGGGQC